MTEPRTGGQTTQAFLQSVQGEHPEAGQADWSGDIRGWSDEHVAQFIRSIARDYLLDFGEGTRWSLAGQQAAFVLASLYYNGHPDLHTPEWELGLAPEGLEGFSVRLRYSVQHQLPPVPLLSGAGANQVGATPESMIVASMARLSAPFDVLDLPASLLARATRQLMDMSGLPNRWGVMLSGALFTLWRSCQYNGVVKGGAIFKQMTNPQAPDREPRQVRLGFERLGPEAEAALSAAIDGGAYLLR